MANPQFLMAWSAILLISSFIMPKKISAQDSCRGKCGDKYQRGYKCQCDTECLRYGECCKDYKALCTSETSCSGRCFETHERSQKCHCDSKCVEYNECCPDYVANCEKDSLKNPTTALLTTRSTSLSVGFTWKPSTAEQSEFTSHSVIQQDSASHLSEETKIMIEPTKPRNESFEIFVPEESNTMDPNLEIAESKRPSIPKELASERIKYRSTQPTFRDESVNINPSSLDKEGTEAIIPEKNMYPEISQNFVSSHVTTVDPDNFDNAATIEPITPENVETMLPNLNKKAITGTLAPEDPTTDYKVVNKERMTIAAISESGSTDSDFLDTDRMTMSPVDKDVTINSKSLVVVVMTEPTIPDEADVMDSNSLAKEGTIKPIAPNGSATLNPANVNKEESQSTVSTMYAITYPEIALSSASNKGTLVNLDNLDNAATTQLIPPEGAATIHPNWDNEGTIEPTVSEDGAMNSKSTDNEKTQTTVPKGYETFPNLDKDVTKHTAPEGSTPGSKIFDQEGTTKLADPEEDHGTDSKILDKGGITKPTITEESTVNSESLDVEDMQITVPGRSARMHPETSHSFAQNRAITVDSNNWDTSATKKSISPEEAETILSNLGKVGTTRSTVPENGTTDFKSLDNDGQTEPSASEEHTKDSKSLDKEATTTPIIHEDSTTDYKILDKEEMTMLPVNEDGTKGSKSEWKEGRTESTDPVNGATDSKVLDEERTMKPTIAEGTVNSGSLNNEDTHTTFLKEPVTRYPGISQTFAPNRAITVDPNNLDNSAITTTIPPEEAVTILPIVTKKESAKTSTPEEHTVDSKSLDKEATTIPIVSEDRTTDSKILDSKEGMKPTVPNNNKTTDSNILKEEGTANPTIAEEGTMNTDYPGNEEKQTITPKEYKTLHPEISHSIAPKRTITVDPANLDNAATIQSIPPEDTTTMFPNVDKEVTTIPHANVYDSQSADKEGTTKHTVPEEDVATDSEIFDIEGTTKPTTVEDDIMNTESLDNKDTQTTAEESTTMHPEITQSLVPNRGITVDPDRLDNAATMEDILPEESITMLLNRGGTTKSTVPQDGTVDSKSVGKEGTIKSTTSLGSATMDSDNFDKEEVQTTPAEKYVTMYPEISQSFAPNRTISVDPDNMGILTIKQPITPEEAVTILQNLTNNGATVPSPPEDHTADSKSLDKKAKMPTVSEDSITDSKTLDKEEVTTPDVAIDSRSLDKEVTVKLSAPKEDNTTDSKIMDKEGTAKPTIPEFGIMNTKSLDNEYTQTIFSEKYTTMHAKIAQSFSPKRVITVGPNNLNNAVTIQSIPPEDAETMFPNLDEERTTNHAVPEEPVTMYSDKVEEESQPTVSEKVATMFHDISWNITPNRASTLGLDNLDKKATIKPIPPKEVETMLLHVDIVESVKHTIPEDNSTGSNILDKGGMTLPTVLKDGATRTKVLDKEATTKPITPEDSITDLESLHKKGITKPFDTKDHTTHSKAIKILDKEETTIPPLNENGTMDSQSVDKAGTTKHTVPGEDDATGSEIFDIEGTKKPTIAQDDAMNIKSLDNEDTQTTAEESTTKYLEIAQSFAPKTAITVDPDNVAKMSTIEAILPKEAITMLLNREGTTKSTAPQGGTVDSKFLDEEGTTKSTTSLRSATMHSDNIDKEEIWTTLGEKYVTMYPEISQSFAPNRTTSVDPDNMDILALKQPITLEEAVIILQNLTNNGAAKPSPPEQHTVNSKPLDKKATATFTVSEGSITDSKIVDKGGVTTPPVNKVGAIDSKSLDKEGSIKPEEDNTTDSKIMDKEGTAKPIIAEDGIMNTESLDNENTQTTLPEESTTMQSKIAQSFSPNRTISVNPDNLNNAATIEPNPPEDAASVLSNIDKETTIKLIVPQYSAIHTKSLDKEGTTKLSVTKGGTTHFKFLDREQTTKATISGNDIVDSNSLDKAETTKSTAFLGSATMDSDNIDKEEIQITLAGNYVSRYPGISHRFVPNRATSVDHDNLAIAATMQPNTPEDIIAMVPNLGKERTSKPIASKDKIIDKEGITWPTVAEDGTVTAESLKKTETTVPEASATMYPDVSKSIPPNSAINVDPDNLHNAAAVQAIPPKKMSTIFQYLDKVRTTKSTVLEGGTLDSKSLGKEETTKPAALQESGTIHLNNLHNKGQAQPTIQESPLTEPDFSKERMTKYTAAAGSVTTAPTLKKASQSQHNVLERTVTVKPANLDGEGMVNSKESITTDLSLETETVKPIIPDKYTEKDPNLTIPDHIVQDSDDNLITNVTLPSATLRSQTSTKIPSYEDRLNDPNLCNKRPSNAMTTLQNGTTYVFRGNLFWTIDQNRKILGNAGRISDVWGIPSPIDTVFTRCNCNGKTFFFKGDQYWRFQNGVMDQGYPRLIATGFSGLNGKIRAALSVAAHNNRPETVYFFKNGGLYQKYVYQRSPTTCGLRTMTDRYPVLRQRFKRQTSLVIKQTIKTLKTEQLSIEMSVRKYWHGLPTRITSAVSFPNHQRAEKYEYYVLSGDKYYNIDPVNQKAINTRSSVTKDLYGCNEKNFPRKNSSFATM